MSKMTRVGVDLAKSVIQVNAVDASGKLVTNWQLSRDKVSAVVRAATVRLPDDNGGLWWLPPLGPQIHSIGAERKNHRSTPCDTLPVAGQRWQE